MPIPCLFDQGKGRPVIAERVLSLDVSSKTGWALAISSKDGIELLEYGTQEPIPEPEGAYPGNFVDWAMMCFRRIVELIERTAPDVLVIEETSAGSKSIFSQKILEYIHFLLAKYIRDNSLNVVYFLTEVWRREVGCVMSKEEKKKNKEVRDYKKKNRAKIAYDKEGKRIGIVGRKHVNVRRANEVFGLNLKLVQNDLADATMLGYAYHLRKMRSA